MSSKKGVNSTPPDLFLGFTRASENVYFYAPTEQDSNQDTHSTSLNKTEPPGVIIIFGWMDAQAAHIQKYLDYYRAMFPRAAIVVVRSRSSLFWTNTRGREEYLRPLLRVLREQRMFEASPPPILMHVFSNGGMYVITELSRIISARSIGAGTSTQIPPSCLIVDSCPGSGGLGRALKAFTALIKSPFLKLLACIPIGLILVVLAAWRWISGKPELISEMRTRLERPSLFPWMSETTPRLYVYSDTDAMIAAEDVEEHVAVMRRKGLDVRTEKFHGTTHVTHARSDPDRYWGAIQQLWIAASKASDLE